METSIQKPRTPRNAHLRRGGGGCGWACRRPPPPTARFSCQPRIISASDIVWDHLARESSHDCTDRSPRSPSISQSRTPQPTSTLAYAWAGYQQALVRGLHDLARQQHHNTSKLFSDTPAHSDSSNRITDRSRLALACRCQTEGGTAGQQRAGREPFVFDHSQCLISNHCSGTVDWARRLRISACLGSRPFPSALLTMTPRLSIPSFTPLWGFIDAAARFHLPPAARETKIQTRTMRFRLGTRMETQATHQGIRPSTSIFACYSAQPLGMISRLRGHCVVRCRNAIRGSESRPEATVAPRLPRKASVPLSVSVSQPARRQKKELDSRISFPFLRRP